MTGSRRVFLIASLLCVGCGSQDPLPDISRSPAPVTVDSEFVGCYERVGARWSVRFVAPWETPRTFYLANEIQGVVEIDGAPLTLRWVRQVSSYEASGNWRLKGRDTIHVAWTTEFEGVSVTLRRRSADGVWGGSEGE